MPGLIVVDGIDGGDYSGVRLPENWVMLVAPKRGEVGGRMEDYFKTLGSADFYSIVNDDVVPLTPGWDVALARKAGLWNVVYPDDTLNGERMATQFVVGGELVRAVGSFSLGFIHTMVDRAWMDIGRAVDRLIYVPEIKLRHDHWSAGRSARDKTYERIFEGRGTIPRDRLRYKAFLQELPALVKRLKTAIPLP